MQICILLRDLGYLTPQDKILKGSSKKIQIMFHLEQNILQVFFIWTMTLLWIHLLILQTVVNCYEIRQSALYPTLTMTGIQNCQLTQPGIQIANKPISITMARNQLPLDLNQINYLQPTLNRDTKGVLSGVNSQTYQISPNGPQNTIQMQGLNNQRSNISAETTSKSILLKGVQNLIEESNNRVIGRLNSLQTKVERLIGQKNSIIGTIPSQMVSTTGQTITYPTIASILSQYNQNSQGYNLYQSEPLTTANLIIGGNKVVYSRSQPQEAIITVDQRQTQSQCESGYSRGTVAVGQSDVEGQRQVIDMRQTQRRIDYLQAEMLARQQKIIMDKLKGNFYMGDMGSNYCSTRTVSPNTCQYSTPSACSCCGRLTVPSSSHYP